MSNSNIIRSSNSVSGFYHDYQKNNNLLKVTLHPNTLTSDGGKSWRWLGEDNYDETPILVSIVRDDFQVGISNNWTDFSAGDTLTSLWNEFKPLAPYLGNASENLEKMYSTGENMKITKNEAFNEKIVQYIHKGVGKLKEYADIGAEYLNRSLVVQGTRFSYYSGTGVAFGNLNMKVTIFADWKNGVFTKVDEQLEKLYPYIMGTYEEMKSGDTLINDFFGWQKPPAGFKANVKNLDNVQEGTLQLRVGSYYCLDNLVVKDVQLNFSKQMVKHPNIEGDFSPLYCDVELLLQPATKYSDVSLKKFVSGKRMEKTIKETEDKLIEELNKERTNNSKLINKYYNTNNSSTSTTSNNNDFTTII